ncbi:hypothetical protein WPS_28480 [Vulcanimicrobium alpinum]|uniref:Uncharacterized protein n=1 Tax=Vulcanimicrobium alpinum TaxID=3016050 RepID=A0AAN2CBB5_UNVUL|nr:hypothetical protein [Vulcanimicrobium alpinum]BDE07572.1 hypothetical protein WPS_28480 [Vulcanimicrobium alpinum]
MQQTLPRPASATNRLLRALARLAKHFAPEPRFDRDMVLTDELERELALREFRRWR